LNENLSFAKGSIIKIILEDNKHRPVMKAEVRKKIPHPLLDKPGE
jgi:hypothetical protein